MRIGITQRVEDVPGRGERRDCLDQAWAELLGAMGWRAVPVPNRTADARGYLDELRLEGLILSGGNDLAHLPGASEAAPERDALENALLDVAARARLPVLGVCRGMQMLVSRAGGSLRRAEGHVATRHALAASADAGGMPLPAEVNSFHGWGVDAAEVGAEWRIVARAPDGLVEAIVHERLPQWGVMWHPERGPERASAPALLRALFERGAP